MKTAMLLWQAITPVHPGTGADSATDIDLPVAREGATGYPMIPASTLKGVLRDGLGLRPGDEDATDTHIQQARTRFGYADRPDAQGNTRSGAGDLTFTDARLLCLPVPSFAGTFALVTCPLILSRLDRDRRLMRFDPLPLPPSPGQEHDHLEARVTTESLLDHHGRVILNDLDFTTHIDPTLTELCPELTGDPDAAATLAQRLCLVDDDVFTFLAATSLEVTAHIRLDPDKKTVQKGALWYEETLPAESLLTSLLISSSGDLSVLEDQSWCQLGGRGTVGRGLVALTTVGQA